MLKHQHKVQLCGEVYADKVCLFCTAVCNFALCVLSCLVIPFSLLVFYFDSQQTAEQKSSVATVSLPQHILSFSPSTYQSKIFHFLLHCMYLTPAFTVTFQIKIFHKKT